MRVMTGTLGIAIVTAGSYRQNSQLAAPTSSGSGTNCSRRLKGQMLVLRNNGYRDDGNSPVFTALCKAIDACEGKTDDPE